MFANIIKCPFCKSPDGIKIEKDKIHSDFYGEKLFNESNIKFEEAKKDLEIKKCRKCSSIYFSRWFNDQIQKDLFLSVYGQHNRGWQNFYKFKDKNETINHGDLFKKLNRLLRIENYGEYGCPFSGLMFDFFKKENPKNDKNKIFLDQLMVDLSNNDRFLKKKKIKKRFNIKEKFQKAVTKNIIIDESFLIWGRNCRSNNGSCLALSKKLFKFNLYHTNEIKKKKQFDVFGFFNTLDHSKEPLEILRKALSFSRSVIIQSHANDEITCQHSYFFTKDITNFLNKIKIYSLNLTKKINFNSKNKYPDMYIICSSDKKDFSLVKNIFD